MVLTELYVETQGKNLDFGKRFCKVPNTLRGAYLSAASKDSAIPASGMLGSSLRADSRNCIPRLRFPVLKHAMARWYFRIVRFGPVPCPSRATAWSGCCKAVL